MHTAGTLNGEGEGGGRLRTSAIFIWTTEYHAMMMLNAVNVTLSNKMRHAIYKPISRCMSELLKKWKVKYNTQPKIPSRWNDDRLQYVYPKNYSKNVNWSMTKELPTIRKEFFIIIFSKCVYSFKLDFDVSRKFFLYH